MIPCWRISMGSCPTSPSFLISHPGPHVTSVITCAHLLWLRQASDPPCLCDLGLCRRSGQVSIKCPSAGLCLMFFSCLDWGRASGGTTGLPPCSLHHTRAPAFSLVLTSPGDVALHTWLRRLCQVSPCRVPLSPSHPVF